MRSLFIRLTMTILVFTGQVRAQAQDDSLKLRTELVQIDVVVLDKKNRPVHDLKAEDFIVLEDDRPYKLEFFTAVHPAKAGASRRVDTADTTAAIAGQDAGRHVFLILDPQFITTIHYPRLRRGLMRLVDEGLARNDRLSVISLGGGFAGFQNLANREVVKTVISNILDSGIKLSEMGIAGGLAEDKNLRSSQPQLDRDFALRFREYRVRNSLQGLRSLAERVADLPGRKMAIYVSEFLPVWENDKVLSEIEVGKGAVKNMPEYGNYSFELQKITEAARRAGLILYSLTPDSLTSEPLFEPNYSQMGLRQLAESTGGFSIENTNKLFEGLQRALADNETYYLPGYYSNNLAADDKFRRIKVGVKDRPDLTVRARTGYIAPGAKTLSRPVSKAAQVNQAIASPVPVSNVRVLLGFEGDGGGVFSAERPPSVVVHIDPAPWFFKRESDKQVAGFEIVGQIFDLKGKRVGGVSKTLSLTLAPDKYSRTIGSGIDMPIALAVKRPGIYNIRVAVRDHLTGYIGTASEWVTIK